MRFSLRSKQREGHWIVYDIDIHGKFAAKQELSDEELQQKIHDAIISDIEAKDIKIYRKEGR